MAFFIALIAVEAVLILLSAPVPIAVRVHAGMSAAKFAAEVKVLGARAVTVTVQAEKDGVRLRINGKKLKPSSGRKHPLSAVGAVNALRAAGEERAVRSGSVSLLIGAEDCADGALLWGAASALACALPQRIAKRSFFAPGTAAFFVDAEIKARVSVFSGLRIARALFKG